MRSALVIARRELASYFSTPWAYVVFTALFTLSAFFFVSLLQTFIKVQDMAREAGWAQLVAVQPELGTYRNFTDGIIIPLWASVAVVLIFVVPFVTMRLFAEDRRQNVLDLLMTAPLHGWELVLGKFLGASIVIASAVLLNLAFPLALTAVGQGIEWPTVLVGIFSLCMWGAACVAVGTFISALTESQMLAALLSFAVLLPWMLLKGVADSVGGSLRDVLNFLSFETQLQEFLRGVIEFRAVVFFASVALVALFLTERALAAQRWR
jgi:ABC-2 type transport system permease protein